jgi:cation diffusion facilitator CzcD-associated flavoprotein CzcO
MPLLEETGYMPTHKYASGSELREHAERIATKWDLHDKTLFRTNVKAVRWDDAAQLWKIEVTEGRGPSEPSRELVLQAQYVLIASGVLTTPQVPKIPGLESFTGPIFHTARWNYKVTGGSPEDQTLTGLEGKRVGIIGTGATAIQVVPKLAKFAKELYVFQRTPSAVSWRGQRPTDPEEW